MLDAPPRESERASWLAAALWTLVVYATIPAARAIQETVRERWGSVAFAVTVIACIALAGAAALRSARRRPAARAGAPWLALVAAIFAGYTLALRANPEEALHFVEYGALGVLLYRALLHRLRDAGIYVAAALLGACAGIVDEAIQWLTPERYWDLRDVWINAFAASLVQIGIAFGLRPALVAGAPGPLSVRWVCRSGAAAALLLGLSLLNTPPRIAWYAERVPGLGFLLERGSTMLEYGHLVDDPEAGRFRSRLAPEALRRADAERAAEAAAVLDGFRDDESYERFLALYWPGRDPFVHEARVHLFRRDRYLANALALAGSEESRDHATIAWHEQRILERWFGATLGRSSFALDAATRAKLDAARRRGTRYESPVSAALVTRVGEREVALALLVALAALLAIDRKWGRERA